MLTRAPCCHFNWETAVRSLCVCMFKHVSVSVCVRVFFLYCCSKHISNNCFWGRTRENAPLKSENSVEKVFHELETHSPEYFRLAPTAIRTVQSKQYQQQQRQLQHHQMDSTAKHDKCECTKCTPKTHSILRVYVIATGILPWQWVWPRAFSPVSQPASQTP